MGETIANNVGQEFGTTGELDLDNLLVAHRRLERAQADAAWLEVLLRRGFKAKVVLGVWEEKDEVIRRVDGKND